MRVFKKMKFVSLLIAITMALGLVPVALPQQAGVAQAATIGDAVNQLLGVYFWLNKDAAGLAAVNNAKTATGSLPLANVKNTLWGATPILPLTSIVPSKYATEDAAKDAIAQLLIDAANANFSSDAVTAQATLSSLISTHSDTLAKLLPGVSVDVFITTLVNAQTSGVSTALSTNPSWKTQLQSSDINTVRTLVTTTLRGALNSAAPPGSAVATAFATNGWSIQQLADAETAVQALVDTGYRGQLALLKAYVRSQTHFSGTTANLGGEESIAVTVGTPKTGQIQVLGQNITSDLTYYSPSASVTVSASGGVLTVTGVSATSSPVEIVAYPTGADQNTNWVYKANVTVTGAPGPGGGGGGGLPAGSGYISPGTGGTVSLGSEAKITIPAGALQGTSTVNVTIKEVTNPPAPPEGYSIIGAYSFTIGGQESYTFKKPVTLTFTFDPADVPEGQTPAVYYYNGTEWVLLTGTVSGNTITVTVDHFTTFGVLVKEAEVTPPPVPAPSFSDVTASYWAFDVIGELSSKGILAGYPDGTFKPDNKITRAEFAKIATLALKAPAVNPSRPTFSDYTPGDWFFGSVETAVYAGLVKGYEDGTFRPNALISREEAATILERSLGKADEAAAEVNTVTGFVDDAKISTWARGFVVLAGRDGLIEGYPDGIFIPQGNTSRAEASAMISRILVLLSKES
jgi:hypothetical protein